MTQRFLLFASLLSLLDLQGEMNAQTGDTKETQGKSNVRFIDSNDCFINYDFRYKFKHAKHYRVKGYDRGDFWVSKGSNDILSPNLDYHGRYSNKDSALSLLRKSISHRAIEQYKGLSSGDDFDCKIDSVITKDNAFGTRYFEVYLTYTRGEPYEGHQYKIYFIDISTPGDLVTLMTPMGPEKHEADAEVLEFLSYFLSVIQRF